MYVRGRVCVYVRIRTQLDARLQPPSREPCNVTDQTGRVRVGAVHGRHMYE